MKNRLLFIPAAILLIAILVFIKSGSTNEDKLINPSASAQIPAPSPTPTPTQYIYDSSTDLKTELETVLPEVKSSDFKAVEAILPRL